MCIYHYTTTSFCANKCALTLDMAKVHSANVASNEILSGKAKETTKKNAIESSKRGL